jgi:multiple sugar transport system ATP-binding protein
MSFGLRVAGLPHAEVARRVDQVAQMLKITELLDRKPSELSGGERQRVAIGRALVREVGVYLFDEPLSNLDAQLRVELRVEIKRLHQRLRATMIYVTHDQIEALTLADRIAVMKDRIIQQIGTPHEVYQRPANRFVASFVGSPSMNFVAGQLRFDAGGAVFTANDFKFPLQGYEFSSAAPDGAAVELGVRPEHIEVAANGRELSIEMVESMGSDLLAWTKLGGAPISLRLPVESPSKTGDRVAVTISPAKVSLFDRTSGRRL